MPMITVSSESTRHLQCIADSLCRSKKTLIVTGAGISTNAGIPDFRSTNGLYALVKSSFPNAVVKGRDLFDSILFADPVSTQLFYTFIASLRNETRHARPTPTHKLIRVLSETGRLQRCYTQNIDGLEAHVGMSIDLSLGKGKKRKFGALIGEEQDDKDRGCEVVQLHGNLDVLRCSLCAAKVPYTEERTATLLTGAPPPCPICAESSGVRAAAGKRATKVGTLRPDIVLYGEEHPAADSIGSITAADVRSAPEMLVVLGTSLKVHGLKRVVKEFSKAVHAKGGSVVFVNNTAPAESQWKDTFDFWVDMDCDDWVRDVKERRPDIVERQTKLPVQRVTKPAGNENKPKRASKSVPSTPSRTGRSVLGVRDSNLTDGIRGLSTMATPASRKRTITKARSPKKSTVPGTPSALRTCTNALPTPPSTAKRAFKKTKSLQDDVQATPTKRRKVCAPPMDTPPATPHVPGGRTTSFAIRIPPLSWRSSKLGEEIAIYRDEGAGDDVAKEAKQDQDEVDEQMAMEINANVEADYDKAGEQLVVEAAASGLATPAATPRKPKSKPAAATTPDRTRGRRSTRIASSTVASALPAGV